jgi:hypothetical protein
VDTAAVAAWPFLSTAQGDQSFEAAGLGMPTSERSPLDCARAAAATLASQTRALTASSLHVRVCARACVCMRVCMCARMLICVCL